MLVWPSPPPNEQIKVTLTPPPPVFQTSPGPAAALLPGPSGAPIWYVVDNPPFPGSGPNDLPLQTQPTIGDRMDARGVTWAWYWDAHQGGVEGIPPPWLWFKNYAADSTPYALHVIGGTPAPTRTPETPSPTATRIARAASREREISASCANSNA